MPCPGPGSKRARCAELCRAGSRTLAAGLALWLATGCDCVHEYSLTSRLWDNRAFGRFNEPARHPDLRVFESPESKDVRVEYDECSDDQGHTRRRAFLLFANQDRLNAERKPRYLKPDPGTVWRPIPTVPAPELAVALPAGKRRFAVVSTNGCQFQLCDAEETLGPFSLPTYETAAGSVWRVVVTPVAVVGDAAMGGLIVGGIGALFVDWGSMAAFHESHSATAP